LIGDLRWDRIRATVDIEGDVAVSTDDYPVLWPLDRAFQLAAQK
jgi:hypothetical protein